MFAARGIAVSLSLFVIIYGMVSLTVVLGWRRVSRYATWLSPRRAADLLFALRMLPLIAASLVTATFTVPSFLLLEPRTINEPLGGVLLALGSFGLILGGAGVVKAAFALRTASRAVAEWSRGARPARSQSSVPVLTVSPGWPAIAVTGILRPRILVSRAAELELTGGELEAALNHELAHARVADNFKKLLLRFVSFPGMESLEAKWLETIELAADDSAVATAGDALDLAAALIKLSHMLPEAPTTDLAAALVHRPVSTVSRRVERLLEWSEEPAAVPGKRSRWLGLSLGLAATFGAVAMVALAYNELLVEVHTATEWLVR